MNTAESTAPEQPARTLAQLRAELSRLLEQERLSWKTRKEAFYAFQEADVTWGNFAKQARHIQDLIEQAEAGPAAEEAA